MDSNDALESIEYSTSSPYKFSLRDIFTSYHFSRGLQDLLEPVWLEPKGSQERE